MKQAKPAKTLKRRVWFTKNGQAKMAVTTAPAKSPSPNGARVPRLARLLALAIRYGQLLESGQVRDLAELSQMAQVSTARISQLMNLCRLAPDIQEEILFLPETAANRDLLSERDVRPIALEPDWKIQRQMWARLIPARL